MAKFMCAQVTNKILGIIYVFNYVALTCEEVNIVDNKS
jgi:hypothetical protein